MYVEEILKTYAQDLGVDVENLEVIAETIWGDTVTVDCLNIDFLFSVVTYWDVDDLIVYLVIE